MAFLPFGTMGGDVPASIDQAECSQGNASELPAFKVRSAIIHICLVSSIVAWSAQLGRELATMGAIAQSKSGPKRRAKTESEKADLGDAMDKILAIDTK